MVEIERFGWLKTQYLLPSVLLAIVAFGSSAAFAGAGANRRLKEAEYVSSAFGAKAALRACVHVHVDAPATNTGPAPAPLAAILGVLRQPSASPSTLPALNEKLFTASYHDTYVSSVRFARAAFGNDWYVFVAGAARDAAPLRNLARCTQAQSVAFRRERPRIPHTFLQATQRMFRADVGSERQIDTAERRSYANPQVGADLDWLATNDAGLSSGWTAYASISALLVNTAQSIARQGFIENVDTFNGGLMQSLVAGIVPDGVTTVMLHFSAQGGRIHPPPVKAHAINNVFVAAVPNTLAQRTYTVTLRWRTTNGSTIQAIP